jgi:hypothetical protein
MVYIIAVMNMHNEANKYSMGSGRRVVVGTNTRTLWNDN